MIFDTKRLLLLNKEQASTMTTRGYLEHTVVPILIEGLKVVALERYDTVASSFLSW